MAKKELESLRTDLDLEKEWKYKEKGWKGQLGKLRKEQNELEARNAELEEQLNSEKDSSKVIPFTHKDLPSWLPKCPGPNCNDKNPNYKKEISCTECDGNLGGRDDLKSLESCPHCEATGDIAQLNEEEIAN